MLVQFPELNRLIYDLSTAPTEVKESAGEAVGIVIKKVEGTAKGFVPVRTGTARDLISSEVREDAGIIVGEAGPEYRGKGTFYPAHLEWGTSKMPPQAFMGPALDRHSHELDELLGSAAESSISYFGGLLNISA